MPDDLRINPYAQVTERVSGVKDQPQRHRREPKHDAEEPQDVVEIREAEVASEARPPEPMPEDSAGLDVRI